MAQTLSPAPASLGLSSPQLGPWFSIDALTLPVPNADLSVTINVGNQSVRWLPPANGLLSYFVVSNPRPAALHGLRQASGEAAFESDRIVALFTLLPEAAWRLDWLMRQVPSVLDANQTGNSPRARIRYLALELDRQKLATVLAGSAVTDSLADIIEQLPESQQQNLEDIGLVAQHRSLVNADEPAYILVTANQTATLDSLPSIGDSLVQLNAGEKARLWAFDDNGRPLDPGAVAAWWSYLATVAYDNLWADGLTAAEQRTVSTNAFLGAHAVNLHEGPLQTSAAYPGQVPVNWISHNSNVQPLSGSSIVFECSINNSSQASEFTASGQNNHEVPMPKLAALPEGTLADSAALWPADWTTTTGISRDFVRLAYVELEGHLTGQRRMAPTGASAETQRRADAQQRESTRIRIGRSQNAEWLTTTDNIADELLAVVAAGDATWVTSVLDAAWGPFKVADFPDQPLPQTAPTVESVGIRGANAGSTGPQWIALKIDTGAGALQGAWVRAYPTAVDLRTGKRRRLVGGGGRCDANGIAWLALQLPGSNGSAPAGIDLLLHTQQGRRIYPDLRFEAPATVGGNAANLASAPADVRILETGETIAQADLSSLSDRIPPGATLLAMTQPEPTWIKAESITAGQRQVASVVNRLQSGDQVRLTEPAFRSQPAGDIPADLPAAATIEQATRSAGAQVINPGTPLPGMEALDVLAAHAATNDAGAVLGSTPTLTAYHEHLPHQSGHPGVPAGVEIHGTGVRLDGTAAVHALEAARGRFHNRLDEAVKAAAATPPSVDVSNIDQGQWSAILRTVAVGVETKIAVNAIRSAFGLNKSFTVADTLEALQAWLEQQMEARELDYISDLVADALDNATLERITRAIDRRLLAGAYGLQESMIALLGAIDRAEDFLYIETPALDALDIRLEDNSYTWVDRLVARMETRPALRVAICVSRHSLPGIPPILNEVRQQVTRDAVKKLQETPADGRERVAVFCPASGSGRSLRLAATTVIVDDAFCMSGTTHLWRRGLTLDISMAVALVEDQLEDGRPQDIRAFRRRLTADRLGLPLTRIPIRGSDMVPLVSSLALNGGFRRLHMPALPVDQSRTSSEVDLLDPVGGSDHRANLANYFQTLINQVPQLNENTA